MEIPIEALSRVAAGAVKPGEVYRMELTPTEGVTPKNEGDVSRNKYFIVVGVAEGGGVIGFVLINTEINPRLPQQVRDMYYKLRAADYPFLQKDRYACCGELKEIRTGTFFRRLRQGAVGTIEERHMDAICGILAASPNVSAQMLRAYGII